MWIMMNNTTGPLSWPSVDTLLLLLLLFLLPVICQEIINEFLILDLLLNYHSFNIRLRVSWRGWWNGRRQHSLLVELNCIAGQAIGNSMKSGQKNKSNRDVKIL